MKVRSHRLSPPVARGIAVICTAVFVTGAHTAQAGINVWTSHGPSAGALAIDATTPGTLYAGNSGGVFKSTDGGNTWSVTNTGLPETSYVSALALDPTTPGTLYAGGDAISGVFKSTDGGGTWSAADAGLPETAYVSVLVLDPTTPGTLYARTGDGGVFKSSNAAGTWFAANTGLPEVGVSFLAVDPTAPSTLYAAPGVGAVFKSTNAGGTWGEVWVDQSCFPYALTALAVDPTTSGTLYLGVARSSVGCDVYDGGTGVRGARSLGRVGSGGVMKSSDGGATWTAVASPGLGVSAFALDPAMPGTLYVVEASQRVFASPDGGGSWSALSAGLPETTSISALAVDLTTPGRLYAATDGGVFSIQQVAVCIGDCSGTDSVAVNNLLTLVNIALGTAEPATCPDGGLPVGGNVTVAVIIQAVNNALNGCGTGQ